jgi:hypothetical protein
LAGPASVTGFAELFAATHDVRVLVRTHPGFGGTPRPEALGSIPGLAALYNALPDQFDLQDVTVIGNSIGGWITAEIALLKSPRVSGIVLIDAVGIDVPGHPVADFFSLTMDQVFQRSFHNPEPFRIDPATLPPAAQAIAAGNRAAISVYAGAAMTDPTLLERLGSLEIPALVLWGRSDGTIDVTTGAPTPPRSPWPGSSCYPRPGTPRNWRLPTRSSMRSGTARTPTSPPSHADPPLADHRKHRDHDHVQDHAEPGSACSEWPGRSHFGCPFTRRLPSYTGGRL